MNLDITKTMSGGANKLNSDSLFNMIIRAHRLQCHDNQVSNLLEFFCSITVNLADISKMSYMISILDMPLLHSVSEINISFAIRAIKAYRKCQPYDASKFPFFLLLIGN